MNLVLHGVEDSRIEQNDTLRNPAFTDASGALATFDCVIANPPFSLKEWGREVWEADPWGRTAFGLPPASYGDYAWVQQMAASMAEHSGRMAVVLPQGALFRKGAEGRIPPGATRAGPDRGGDRARAQYLLRHRSRPGGGDAAPREATGPAREDDRDRRVGPLPQGRAQNFLDPAHAEQIVGWVRRFRDVEDRAKVVSTEEIEREDWTLNISRYVPPPVGKDVAPLPEALAALRQALAEARSAEDRLRLVLVEDGWLE